MIYFIIQFEEDYKRVVDVECITTHFKYYDTISKALDACSSDNKCLGVEDMFCDNMNEFSLCKEGIQGVQSAESGCTYKKAGSYGTKLH